MIGLFYKDKSGFRGNFLLTVTDMDKGMHTAWFWYTPEGVWRTGLQSFSRKRF